jgi:hypothetical protein
LTGGNLHAVLARRVDIHFNPEGAWVDGPIAKRSGVENTGISARILDPVQSAGVSRAIIVNLYPITIASCRVISKHQTAKRAAIHRLAHGNLQGSGPAIYRIVNQEVVNRPMGTASLQRKRPAALAPISLHVRNRPVLPSIGRAPTPVKGIGHGTLLGRITLELGHHCLLPHAGFGGLRADV